MQMHPRQVQSSHSDVRFGGVMQFILSGVLKTRRARGPMKIGPAGRRDPKGGQSKSKFLSLRSLVNRGKLIKEEQTHTLGYVELLRSSRK